MNTSSIKDYIGDGENKRILDLENIGKAGKLLVLMLVSGVDVYGYMYSTCVKVDIVGTYKECTTYVCLIIFNLSGKFPKWWMTSSQIWMTSGRYRLGRYLAKCE